MEILLASNNEHKRDEFKRLLDNYTILMPKDLNIEFNPVENGKSFIENAIIKAESLYRLTGKTVLSDDSGLSLDSLSGMPGIYSARFGEDIYKRSLTQREKNDLLLKMLEGKDRTAHFTSALVLYLSPYRIFIVQESTDGRIAENERGSNGFGYDPLFIPEGLEKSYAELSPREKDIYSHRGKALRKLKRLIGESDD